MSSTKSITEKEVQTLIQGKLSRYFGVSPKEASIDQIYKAVVMSVRDILLEKRQQFHKVMKSKKGKRVYYLCMEFLLGRSLKNNIYNLGLGDAYSKALKYFNLTLEDLYEQEPDAGIGGRDRTLSSHPHRSCFPQRNRRGSGAAEKAHRYRQGAGK